MTNIQKTENGYYIESEQADIQLIFMTSDIFRIRISFDKKFEEESYSLVLTAWKDRMDSLLSSERKQIQPLNIQCSENDNELEFKTSKIKLVIKKNPLSFRVYNQYQELIYSDLEERAYEKDSLGRIFHYNKFDLKNDYFYGFGEQTGPIDKKGERMRMSPKDAIGHDPEYGGPLYKHIPFYIKLNRLNQHAYGMFYHNSYESVFDMGKEISGYWDPYSYYQSDGGDIDLFFINGPTVKEVVERYTILTGRQAMPPKQSLGFTASTMYYAELDEYCDEEIYTVIQKHRDYEMYIDNFKLASGYSSGEIDNLRYVFNWNKKRFPDPDAFFNKMNELNINVIVNLKPGILKSHPLMDIFEKNDVFIKTAERDADYIGRWWGGEGRFVDFTKKRGREIWKMLLIDNILKKGTVTVWNDNCEYDGVEDKNAYCDFEGKGSNIGKLKPLQANLMAMAAKEAVASVYPDRRPYIINRSGYAGIQRYAQTWSGDNLTDWRTIRFNIATIIGMGLSGIANTGCDIGGFAGKAPDGELLLRWIQNGIFQPRFCINSANDDNTVTQPWMYKEYNEEIQAAYKKRYEMIPYLYSLMYEANQNGLPIMRPLFMEFQDDPVCYDDDQMTFMFGPSVLVANVLEEHAQYREVYLPKYTSWYHIDNQFKKYEGGQLIRVPVTLNSIPMFLKDDGIFITSEDITVIKRDDVKRLNILIGEKSGQTFIHYEDDGVSKKFEEGEYEKTIISVEGDKKRKIRLQVSGKYKSCIESYILNVVSKEIGAYWVTINQRKLKQYLERSDWENAEIGWYYDLSDKIVLIKFNNKHEELTDVIVSFESFDLIGMGVEE